MSIYNMTQEMKKSSDTIMSSKLFIVFSVFLVAAQAVKGRTADADELPLINGRRVFNGQNAAIGEFPHQVSLQMLNAKIQKSKHWCGGAIIDSLWILTAAHCINVPPSQLVVKAGKINLKIVEKTEQSAPVAKVFVHELFRGSAAPYDIALLKLSTPLKLNKFVSKISLAEKEKKLTGSSTVSGWGSIRWDHAGTPDMLQKAVLPITDYDTCKRINENDKTTICAGGANLSSACRGDSGGPLIQKKASGSDELIGIVSWGPGRCDTGRPTVYVDVAHFFDWIQGIMKNN